MKYGDLGYKIINLIFSLRKRYGSVDHLEMIFPLKNNQEAN